MRSKVFYTKAAGEVTERMNVCTRGLVSDRFRSGNFCRVPNRDVIDANPDATIWSRKSTILTQNIPTMAYVIEAEKCTACAACVDTCPSGAISAAEGGGHYIIDAEKCVDCAACESGCPSSAIAAGA
jgi:NAD-dependent dihydropyrimidine dehydrogenase PreA subunit